MDEVMQAEATPVDTRRRRWPWLVVVLLAVAVGLGWWIEQRRAGAAKAAPAASGSAGGGAAQARATPVVVATAESGDLPISLTELGTITPLASVTVRTRIDGQLIASPFHEGQEVKRGDVLAEIDPRPFQVQLDQARGQLARDQAQLDNARHDLERYQGAGAVIPKQQLDTQAATVAQDEGVVETDKAAIANADLQLSYCRIASPVDGLIGLRLIDPGNMVHASDPSGLAVVTTLRPISAVFTVPQDDLRRVLPAYRAGTKLVAEAYDRDLRQRFAVGVLAAIDNQVDAASGMVRMKADFANAEGALFPNQFVNIRLLVDTLRGAVLVPDAAVQRGPDSTYLYVVGADDTVEMRPVTVGATEGGRTAIAKGLAGGETVVVDGVDKLRQGAKVQASRAGQGGGDGKTEAGPGKGGGKTGAGKGGGKGAGKGGGAGP